MHIHRDFYDRTHYTSAEARNRRPAGEIVRRISPLEAGHPHTSIPRTATHDRAHSNAAMRSHAPQPQTHITKAATADPLIMHRGPPYAQNTIGKRRASIRQANRTQGKGDPRLRPARRQGGWIFGPDQPVTTANGCSRDHSLTKKRLAEAETPNSTRSPKSFSTSRACEH